MSRLIVVGSINQDAVTVVEQHPRPGETVLAIAATVGLGGKGCNQAVAASLAGASVSFVGAVGSDAAGAFAVSELDRFGVDTSAISRIDGVGTGVAYIAVDAVGENTIIVASGANAVLQLDPASLPVDGVLLLQGELPSAVALAVAAHARATGSRLVLNLAPVTIRDEELLRTADPLIVNETEAADLLGASPDDPAAALRERYGVDAIVTIGAAGALVATAGGTAHVPSPRPAEVVDTTGAGDAFVGVLAAGLCAGLDLEAAARRAVAAASHSVESLGTVGSYATAAEIDALVGAAAG